MSDEKKRDENGSDNVAIEMVDVGINDRMPYTKADITMNALQVAREAILALLDNRDFLGYQLSHAHGTISDEQMDGIVDEHFSKAGSFKEGDAARKAAFLAGIVPERFDAELLSTVLGCDIEQAEKAIAIAAKNLDKLLPEPSKLSGFVR